MTKVTILTLLTLNLFINICCAQTNKELSITYNDKAVDIILRKDVRIKNLSYPELVNKANKLLDTAIILDPNNTTAVSNKYNNLISIKSIDDALITIQSARINHPNEASFMITESLILLYKKQTNQANSILRNSLLINEKNFSSFKQKKDLEYLLVNIMLLDGIDKALERFEKEKSNYVNDPNYITYINNYLKEFTINKALGINN